MRGFFRRKKRLASALETGAEPNAESAFYSDQPITRVEEDLFDRSSFAEQIARSISAMPGVEPFVFGLSGPWGSGKTSILNLVVAKLSELEGSQKKTIVFRFSPWWFSRSDSLLLSYLREFAKIVGAEIPGELSDRLADYLEMFGFLIKPLKFVPGANLPAEALYELASSGGAALKKASRLAQNDTRALRNSIDSILTQVGRPILVLIDDIDRLLPDEVIQIFQLLKAVADFPFSRYLIAYDGSKVSEIIKRSTGMEGHELLEKIVQMPIEVPPIAGSHIRRLFFAGLERIVVGTPDYLLDATRVGNAYYDGISLFLASPRAAKRLLNVLRASYPALKGEVDFADFVVIQALRVFAPTTFRLVHDESGWFLEDTHEKPKEEKESFLARLRASSRSEHSEAAIHLLKRTFPRFETLMGGSTYGSSFDSIWSSGMRAASERHFLKYFDLGLLEGTVSNREIVEFIDHLTDSGKTDAWLRSQLPDRDSRRGRSRVGEALTALNDIARSSSRLNDDQRTHLLEALLRVGDELTSVEDEESILGMFTIKNSSRIMWVLIALAEGIHDPATREAVITDACRKGESYITILDFVRLLGVPLGLFGSTKVQKDLGLLDPEKCKALAELIIERTKEAARLGRLENIHDPLELTRLWAILGNRDEAVNWLKKTCQSDKKFLDVIRSAVGESRSWGWSDLVAKRSFQLVVENLCLFLDSRELRDRSKAFLQNDALVSQLDEKTRFGLEQVVLQIRDDGTVIKLDHSGDQDE